MARTSTMRKPFPTDGAASSAARSSVLSEASDEAGALAVRIEGARH